MTPLGFRLGDGAGDQKHINGESAGHRRQRLEGETLSGSPPVDSTPSGVVFLININNSPSSALCNLSANMMYDAIYWFPMIYCISIVSLC
jgi:hypothetical protein